MWHWATEGWKDAAHWVQSVTLEMKMRPNVGNSKANLWNVSCLLIDIYFLYPSQRPLSLSPSSPALTLWLFQEMPVGNVNRDFTARRRCINQGSLFLHLWFTSEKKLRGDFLWQLWKGTVLSGWWSQLPGAKSWRHFCPSDVTTWLRDALPTHHTFSATFLCKCRDSLWTAQDLIFRQRSIHKINQVSILESV